MSYFIILSKLTTLPQLQITCVQDDGASADYDGKYFCLDAPDGSQYYVWFDEDDGSVDPAITGRTGIEVDYSANDTAATIGDALQVAIDGNGDFTATDNNGGIVTVSHTMCYTTGTATHISYVLLEEADYDDTDGWIGIRCNGIGDSALQKNTSKHIAGHSSYRIVTGSFIQGMTLEGVFIFNTGTTESSEYYNAVKEFLLRHMALGTSTEYKYPLYLHVYNPALGNQRIKWMDNSEAMQFYCRVYVKGFNFEISTDSLYWEGSIQLEEAWL